MLSNFGNNLTQILAVLIFFMLQLFPNYYWTACGSITKPDSLGATNPSNLQSRVLLIFQGGEKIKIKIKYRSGRKNKCQFKLTEWSFCFLRHILRPLSIFNTTKPRYFLELVSISKQTLTLSDLEWRCLLKFVGNLARAFRSEAKI